MGDLQEEEWPALFERRHTKDQTLDVGRLARVWRGELDDEYGAAAVISTAAIALQLMDKAQTPQQALSLAGDMWNGRGRDKYLSAA